MAMTIPTYITKRAKDGKCVTCTGENFSFEIGGKQTYFTCREYDKKEIQEDLMMSVMDSDIFATGLVDIDTVPVHGAKYTYKSGFKMSLASKGTNSYGKRDCAKDFQPLVWASYAKKAETCLLHIDNKICMNKVIGLDELQDMFFINGDYFSTPEYAANVGNNRYTDALMMAARAATTKSVELTDIVGIFRGPNEESAHYDGLLAQMYWSNENVIMHSIQFRLEENINDGDTVVVQVGGRQSTFTWDSTGTIDGSFLTIDEVAEAVADWINEQKDATGRRKYNSTSFGSQVNVVATEVGKQIDVRMALGTPGKKLNWSECPTEFGHYTTQNWMPIDERAFLTQYREYNEKNIRRQLFKDIATLMRDMKKAPSGTNYALFIDEKLWDLYNDNSFDTEDRGLPNNLSTKFSGRIFTLEGLEHTGLFFIAPVSASPNRRQVLHLVNPGAQSRMKAYFDPKCDELFFAYKTLHGLMVKNFSYFGGNLLCSPFANCLVEPQPDSKSKIPCWNEACRDGYLTEKDCKDTCDIDASFCITGIVRNPNLYQNEAGEILPTPEEGIPAGGSPVWAVQIEDTTTGIPAMVLDTVNYSYVITTSDGAQIVVDSKDPIINFAGDPDVTITVEQTVTVEIDGQTCEGCSVQGDSTEDAIKLAVDCADLALDLGYTVANEGGVYTLTIDDETDYPSGFDSPESYVVTIGADEFTELPEMEELAANPDGETLNVVVTTNSGCVFSYASDIGAVADGETESGKLEAGK